MVKPVLTPKHSIIKQVQAIYSELARSGITINTSNMRHYFGIKSFRTASATMKPFIITADPVKGGPITFLGRPIGRGINAYMLPILKAAEKEIEESRSKWQPASIFGYTDRGMMIGGKPSTDILSSHAGGLSLDIDHSVNGPTKDAANNRGTIADEVVLAMVRHGFVWGGVARKGFEELGNDPMHFQMSLHPTDERYQEILRTPVGFEYWNALKKAGALPPMAPKAGNI